MSSLVFGSREVGAGVGLRVGRCVGGFGGEYAVGETNADAADTKLDAIAFEYISILTGEELGLGVGLFVGLGVC